MAHPRTAPLFALVVASILAVPAASAGQSDRDRLGALLLERTVPVRTVDLRDDDLSDLEPLIEMVGDARLVQLGEVSHGAGTAFEAKARVIRFLHERMGFDVLVWESGLFSSRLARDALRAGEDPTEAGMKGIFALWTATEQVRPLLAYAQESLRTSRPLEIAGMDYQFSAADAEDRFVEETRSFLDGIRDETLRDEAWSLFDTAMASFRDFQRLSHARGALGRRLLADSVPLEEIQERITAWTAQVADSLEPRPGSLPAFRRSTGALIELLRRSRPHLERMHPPREVAFRLQALHTFATFGETQYEWSANHDLSPEEARVANNGSWNRRDALMARNLRWMLDEYYADRKIVVWAHNGHVMNAHYRADWSGIGHEPQDGGMKPVGAHLADALSDAELFTMSFTAFEGRDQWVGRDGFDVPPAPEGSLEALVSTTGLDYAIVDLDTPGEDGAGPGPISLPMRMRSYRAETVDDWSDVVDAVFYIRTMEPARTWSEAGGS